LLVPTRHWWAYVLAAVSVHFFATQRAGWPPIYALNCEAFDAVKCVAAAAGIRLLVKSPLTAITLRDASLFILIGGVLAPFVTALWGAAFTVSYGYGTRYWIEWRNLGISNAVATIVLTPAILLVLNHVFVVRPRAVSVRRALEAVLAGVCTVALGVFVFDESPAGPGASPALLYAPIPLLILTALHFGLVGISVSILIITFEAIWGTMRGHGPFLGQTPSENALALQLFLLVTATPLLLLAVVIQQEARSKEALRKSERELRASADAMQKLYVRLASVEDDERRALHVELHDQVGANLAALRLELDIAANLLAREDGPNTQRHLASAREVTVETIAMARDLMAELRPPALDDYGLVAALRSFAVSQSTRLSLPIRVTGEDLAPRPSRLLENALFRIAHEAVMNAARHASASSVYVDIASRDGRVRLTIADDGVGFDPAAPLAGPDHWGLKNMSERARAVGGVLEIGSTPGGGTRITADAPSHY
jgi:signal transduction histidine kinase